MHFVYNEETEYKEAVEVEASVMLPQNFVDNDNKMITPGTFEVVYNFTLDGIEQQLIQTVIVKEVSDG